MLRIKILYFIIAACLVWVLACNKSEPVCPDSQAYDFKLALVRIKDSTSTSLKFYNAKGSILTEDVIPTILSVPVDINSDSTTFFIDFLNDTLPTITDTIAFTYTRYVKLRNKECGFTMEFSIQNIYRSGYQIDSAYFLNDSINQDNASNLEIYY